MSNTISGNENNIPLYTADRSLKSRLLETMRDTNIYNKEKKL